MTLRYYANSASTTLAAPLTATATTVTVAGITGFPIQYPFTAIIDKDSASEEVVLVTGASGTTLTITRGYDGTTNFSHAIGATFVQGISAIDPREANAHINATSGVHGTTGPLVDASSAQTLTNKTLGSGTVLPSTTATTNTAQTFTNKTLTAPILTDPVVNGCTPYAYSTASAGINLNGSDALVPGLQVSVTATKTVSYLVIAHTALQVVSTAAGFANMTLYIDGGRTDEGYISLSVGSATASSALKATVFSNAWVVSVPAGTHTFGVWGTANTSPTVSTTSGSIVAVRLM